VRRPWSALVLAAGGLLLLVSLYLPWVATTANAGFGTDSSLLHVFGGEDIGAWSAAAGTPAAVVALYLVGAGATAWMRAIRIPISAPALLAAYFALAITAESRTAAMNLDDGVTTVDVHYARGAYLGITAGLLAVASAFALGRSRSTRTERPTALGLLGTGLAVALLATLLLPWERATFRFEGASASIEYLGISGPASVVAALAAVWVATSFWSQHADRVWKRVLLGSGAALFSLGAFSAADPVLHRTHEAWIALASAFALAALTILPGGRVRVAWVKRLEWRALALAAAPALFLGSLFLPWRSECFPRSFAPDPRAGHCVTLNGWILTGTAAAVLATWLFVVAIRRRGGLGHPVALAAGVLLFAVANAVELTRGSTPPVPVELGYGAFVGMACAVAAIALAVPRVNVASLEWREIGVRALPVALCLAYVAIVMVPPLLEPSFDQPTLFFAPTSWLTVTGVVVATLLIEAWIVGSADRAWLVVWPLCMLALAVVDVVRLRENLAWGAAVVVAICGALLGLGRIEQIGGFRGLRAPEILRVDRI